MLSPPTTYNIMIHDVIFGISSPEQRYSLPGFMFFGIFQDTYKNYKNVYSN